MISVDINIRIAWKKMPLMLQKFGVKEGITGRGREDIGRGREQREKGAGGGSGKEE